MEKIEFEKAKAIWAQGREEEMNCELAFGTSVPQMKNVRIFIATSGIYRLWINGIFKAAGPARAAHGYFRVDEYEIGDMLIEAENEIVIEVLGYYVNSYDTLNQNSFLTAEVRNGNDIVVYTGKDFYIYDRKQRIRKVQRYSFQRAFIDAYHLTKKKSFTEEKIEVQKEPCYIKREVRYPQFEVLKPEAIIEEGKVKFVPDKEKVIKEQEYYQISPVLLGFPYHQVKEHVSEEAQKFIFYPEIKKEKSISSRHIENGYVSFRFPYNATGFYKIDITVEKAGRIYVLFDEILTDGEIDFLRMYSCNCFLYTAEPGHYILMSFAPYTMKYLKIIMTGSCTVQKTEFIEYKHPEVLKRICIPEQEKELQLIYKAAEESFRANSLDVFMDCPSRERGGWLCDSYFTSEVEYILTGENILERAFLDNFVMKEKFKYLPEGMIPMCYPADHNNGNYIPNWGMWFVLELEKYKKHTGDVKFLECAKRTVYGLLSFFRRYENEYGLLENLEGWIFVEWSRANDSELTEGVNFPSNMLYARMLQAAGNLYGDEKLLKKSKELRNVIRKRAQKQGFFTDNEKRTETGWKNTGECTEVCQYYAFFTGIATVEEDEGLWDILVQKFGPKRSENHFYPEIAQTNAFIGNYLRIELLYRNGMYGEVIKNIIDYFLPMAEETGTLWENEKTTGSCNHGFASYVIRWLAGIYGVENRK